MKVPHFVRGMFRPLGVALALGLSVSLKSPASSMTVSPLLVELSTSGPGSRTSLRITNDGTARLPIEIKVSRLEVGEHGESTTTPVTDDFLIIPSHALIPPGGSQAVRVQWVGRGDMQRSQSYLFKVSQLAVKFPETKSGVQFTFHFTVIVNVAPPGAVSSLVLKDVGIETGKDGTRHPAITVVNKGNRHASLADAALVLTGGGWKTAISGEAMRQMVGVGLIQPGKERRFVLKKQILPAEIKGVTGILDYQPTETGAIE